MPHSTPDDWLYKTVLDSFWEYVDKSGDCWIWTGPIHSKKWGYGTIRILGRKGMLAHRLLWQLLNGPIPEGMLVCHSCDNPMCVRPDHLWLGTPKENMHDMIRKGRGGGGLSRLLPDETVRLIRERVGAGESSRSVARSLDLHYMTVYRIISGKRYSDVD